ncbi:MAG: alpha/beta hydrolase, partial [Planctomycetota bacterium]
MAMLTLVMMGGCNSPVNTTQVSLRTAVENTERRWTLTEPSTQTVKWLSAQGFGQVSKRDAIEIATTLFAEKPNDPQAQLAAAELAFWRGFGRSDIEPLALATAAATQSLQLATANGTLVSRSAIHASELQRLALAGLLERDEPWATLTLDVDGRQLSVVASDKGDFAWKDGRYARLSAVDPETRQDSDLIDRVSRIIPADFLEVDGIRRDDRRDGIGTPVAVLLETPDDDGDRLFYPPQGVAVDATAIATLARDDESLTLQIKLIDPAVRATTRPSKSEAPVAAKFGTAFGYMAGEVNLRRSSLALMLYPNRGQRRTGLYLLAPYDPNKIPVVLVHGLKSSPLAWHETVAAIHGHPALRGRYQVLTFYYPTGSPFPLSASRLRQALAHAREDLDPESDDATWNQMVVIAHSMGGLLAQTLVKEGGDEFWHAAFHDRPLEELSPPGVVKKTLRDVVY